MPVLPTELIKEFVKEQQSISTDSALNLLSLYTTAFLPGIFMIKSKSSMILEFLLR